MQTKAVNVAKFFDQQWKTYEQEVERHDAKKAACLKEAGQCVESIESLERELKKKEAVKLQASQNGLDCSPLDKETARIQKEINALQKQREEQERLAHQPGPNAPYDQQTITQFVRHLSEIRREDIPTVPTLSATASHITVSPEDLTLDGEGKVIKAIVRLAKQEMGEIEISAEHSRYAKSFRPKALQWVPLPDAPLPRKSEERHRHEPLQAFFVEDKQEILLPHAYEFRYPSWGTTTNSCKEIEGNDGLFILASSILENAIKAAGGTIRLDQAYEESFLAKIREDIVSLTLDRPRWSTNTEWPDSDTVLASVRDDLLLIVSSPWSDSLNGYWAKLKYTLENGERPRVWRKKHVDHYGIRVRTRDHTWLVGDLFIDRSQPQGKAGGPIENTDDEHTRRIGRMYVWVGEYT